MKRLLISAAALLLASAASAQTSRSDSQSQAIAIAGGGGNDGSVQRTRGRLATTASAIAPGLTAAGVHSCAGSTTAAGGGTGFGFSFGSTYEMQECNRRAYAASLMGLGQNRAALALLCNNAEVMAALNQTGVACPQQVQVTAHPVRSAQPAPAVDYRGSQGSTVAPPRSGVVQSWSSFRDPAGSS
jgi:hypothetical protein